MNTSPDMPSSRPMTLRQQLAAIEHERWADWQEYVHSKGKARVIDGEALWCLPMGLVHAWNKQIATPYAELSEREKASDMEQVDRYWPLIERWCQEIAREARSDWTLELPDLPWFQIKAFNEERAEWWSPIYDTTNLPVELTQKPPQPLGADSHTDIGDTVSGNEADNSEEA